MQSFPDQPVNQPYHAPSEIYVPEQPWAPPPMPISGQAPTPAQEIAIYVNRAQAITRAMICLCCLLLLLAIFPVLALIAALTDSLPSFLDVAPLLIILLPALALVGWITWALLVLAFAHQPIMRIQREGILVRSMPLLSSFSISWGEIDALFVRRALYKYLCILPKNSDAFVKSHFHGLESFIRRKARIGAPLYVPQVYLNKPVEEILQQVYYMYSQELGYYRVQVRLSSV